MIRVATSTGRPARATFLGAGSMGTALANAAAGAGRDVILWTSDAELARALAASRRHPRFTDWSLAPGLAVTTDLADAIAGAELVVVAVHSTEVRALAERLRPLLARHQVVLSATKGLELPTLYRMSEVLAEVAGAAIVGAIGGPNITSEIARRELSALVVAVADEPSRACAARWLETDRLRVRTSADLRSIELVAVLKNVVAIAVGIATGLELGYNARSMLLADGLAEIQRLGAQLGADPAAFAGMAGIADLYLTSTCPQSGNRRLGIELGRGRRLEEIAAELPEVPEGIGAVRGCRALARRHGLELPIADAVAQILDGELPAGRMQDALA